MNKRIPVRILTVLGGLVLLALCAAIAAEGFFGVPVMEKAGELLACTAPVAVAAKIVAALALAVLAVAAVCCALPARRKQPRGYVMQGSAGDSFGITIKSIEKDVRICVAKHPEIVEAEVDVREGRNGLVVLLDMDLVGGVDIPLFVSQLQKQVRQYVQKRTGKEVAEIRVMVDCRTETEVYSDYAVEDTVMCPAAANAEEYHTEGQAAETTVEQLRQMAEIAQQVQPEPEPEEEEDLPVEQESTIVETLEELDAQLPAAVVPDLFEADEKSMHQRVFGAEEMPQMVPVPPEMTAELTAEAEPAEETDAPAVQEPEEAPAEEAEPETEAVDCVPAEQEPECAPCIAEEDVQWNEPSMLAAADVMLTGDLETPAESVQEEMDVPENEEEPVDAEVVEAEAVVAEDGTAEAETTEVEPEAADAAEDETAEAEATEAEPEEMETTEVEPEADEVVENEAVEAEKAEDAACCDCVDDTEAEPEEAADFLL